MYYFKTNITVLSIGSIFFLFTPSNSYSQEISNYADYKKYCSPGAYQYGVQSPECDKNNLEYSTKFQKEISNKEKINTLKFESIQIKDDWRSPDPKLPWSKPVIVESDFGQEYVVFDKNYKKYGDGFFVKYSETGIISKWTTEELSISAYTKLLCDAILGCREKKTTPVGNSIEVLINDSIYKMHGENGIFSIPCDLRIALQKSNIDTYVKIRINGSLVNDIGKKTVESLSLLYSIEDNKEEFNSLIKEKISAVEPLS